jgi:F-type H+-transporting ATPase subunit gamma
VTRDLIQIEEHLDSVSSLEPLMRAIRSVAEVAYRRADERSGTLDIYEAHISHMLQGATRELSDSERARLLGEGAGQQIGVLLVGSERGLCGPFNEQALDTFERTLDRIEDGGQHAVPLVLGSKASRILAQRGFEPTFSRSLPSFNVPPYVRVEELALELLGLLAEDHLDELRVVHHRPAKGFEYETVERGLWPIESDAADGDVPRIPVHASEDLEAFVRHLVTERFLVDLYDAVLHSSASEQLARIRTMRLAVDHVQDRTDDLRRELQRARRHAETQALLQVISGFEAMEGPPDS